MPRCYMVKKITNKHQSVIKECWTDNNPPSSAPESPTEAAVAPIYDGNHANAYSKSKDVFAGEDVDREETSPQGNYTGRQITKARSVEETEAAHDLLSLSQSLPPLQGPGVVTIHQIFPVDDVPTAATPSYAPETAKTCSAAAMPPLPLSYSYSSNILYVVPVPNASSSPPSPPPTTTKCPPDERPSEDAYMKEEVHLSSNEDIIILPLSPVDSGRKHEANSDVSSSTSTTGADKTAVKEDAAPLTSTLTKQGRKAGRNEKKSTVKSKAQKPSEKSAKTKYYTVVEEDNEVSSTTDSKTDDETSDKSNRYICNECGKQYATSSNLSRHKQTHRSLDSQSAKKCMTCGKAYVSMPALAMHLLTHKLSHICGICGKQFSRPWLLQGHLRSHTGERPYGCAHCGKAFADRSNLRAHMQTHSSDKNFHCPRCRKTFALKSYLNKHQESVCQSWSNEKEKRSSEVHETSSGV